MTEQPKISQLLVRWFTWYSRRFIRRHFHSLRVSSSNRQLTSENRPIVIYTNHASWWDPLVGLVVIKTYFNDRSLYAPIDALMLSKYRMFSHMGFFGVEKDSRKGAVDFLTVSSNVLQTSRPILAVTAQGRFADVRERPVNIKRGLAHLSLRVPNAAYIPACIEYVFWEEKLPEILVHFGNTVELGNGSADLETNLTALEHGLEKAQNELAELSQNREAEAFTTVISGRSGLGGVYDYWRSLRSAMRGQRFKKGLSNV